MISLLLVHSAFLVAATLGAPATSAGPAARALRAPATRPSAPVAQTPAPAQGVVAPASKLSGIVVDSAGKPVPRQPLTLHRVAGMSGAMVDSATTDARGRFAFVVPAETDTGAVVFVATRWNGHLYIGSIFKPPVPAGMRDTVRVGVNPVEMGGVAGGAAGSGDASADAGQSMPVQPPASSGAGRWFLAVVLALVALGAVAYALVGATRERGRERRRRLLASIAALDERAETAGGEEAEHLRRERAELLAELTND